ncbi:short-chain dehydrogenase/reductase [Marivirga lumbricoides]|uniref:Short-chain dehydrogenase/reductase n=1 Tax=Marivirga lumbricoides TaxID=1046115 RepID=A0ABQ1MBT4_9BACT|nr:short-chain dehydrogenase/reductase [Marivirga lumbricoides]
MKKVILITGASSGMGKETALKLIKEGHTVYGAARRVDQMQELVKAGGHVLELDVTNEKQIVDGVKQIIFEQEKIDVLWNNAGYGLYGAVEDIAIEDARRQFEVNLFGLARVTQEVLPYMRAQKSGTIINTSSMGGKMYTPLGAWYHATKHALEGWSDCLRLELKQFNIDVVILEPGIIATEFADVLYQPMLKNSGSGPYKNLAKSVASSTKEAYEKQGAASPSSVISQVVSRIISSKSPKTRYVKGKMAKPLMFIRKYFGDRLFDKAVMSQVKM